MQGKAEVEVKVEVEVENEENFSCPSVFASTFTSTYPRHIVLSRE